MFRRLVSTLAATAATTAALAAGDAVAAQADDLVVTYYAGAALAPTVAGYTAGACTATAVGVVASATIRCSVYDPDSGTWTSQTAAGPGTAVAPFVGPYGGTAVTVCYTAVFTSLSADTRTMSGCNTLAPSVT